jgi:hypothetical protein
MKQRSDLTPSAAKLCGKEAESPRRGRPPKPENERSTKRAGPPPVRETPHDAPQPRLLNMRRVAHYLGCSFWTARDYILQGLIPAVDMPPLLARPGERQRKTLRRVLVDRGDLDAFIEARKRPRS